MRGDVPDVRLVGIDWGTTNRRAYVLDSTGDCVRKHEDDQGVMACNGRFEHALQALLVELRASPSTPVLMSGMVGSALGWQQVPYLDCKVPLQQLPAEAVPVQGAPAGCNWRIVPGYCCRDGGTDVMRGEETQLLGAVLIGHRDGWVILPGTHSKWALLRQGKVVRLATYMTGELFSLLSAHGTLSPLMETGLADNPAGLAAGVALARRGDPLSRALFSIRARVVAGDMPATQARACVSGLLIGAEFAAADRENSRDPSAAAVRLIASPALSSMYGEVAALFNMRATLLDPDMVYCAALAEFLKSGVV